ncbi:MAG: hypothetical protein OXC69_01600 [Candidatus Tectomicrobia bacterium]|nr:hypothetical protein [Candidatus Tectomicrobia bacterium]
MTQKLSVLVLAGLVGLLVSGCGGGGDGDQTSGRAPSDDQPSAFSLREMVFDNSGAGQPSYVIAGDNASLKYWMDPFGEVTQSLSLCLFPIHSKLIKSLFFPLSGVQVFLSSSVRTSLRG